MTKKEIIKRIAERGEMTQFRSREILQWILDMVTDSLADEGRVELRNFGVFEVKIRKARKARNPRTNEPLEIKQKKVVIFTPGQDMTERVKRYQPRKLESAPIAPTETSVSTPETMKPEPAPVTPVV